MKFDEYDTVQTTQEQENRVLRAAWRRLPKFQARRRLLKSVGSVAAALVFISAIAVGYGIYNNAPVVPPPIAGEQNTAASISAKPADSSATAERDIVDATVSVRSDAIVFLIENNSQYSMKFAGYLALNRLDSANPRSNALLSGYNVIFDGYVLDPGESRELQIPMSQLAAPVDNLYFIQTLFTDPDDTDYKLGRWFTMDGSPLPYGLKQPEDPLKTPPVTDKDKGEPDPMATESPMVIAPFTDVDAQAIAAERCAGQAYIYPMPEFTELDGRRVYLFQSVYVFFTGLTEDVLSTHHWLAVDEETGAVREGLSYYDGPIEWNS